MTLKGVAVVSFTISMLWVLLVVWLLYPFAVWLWSWPNLPGWLR